MRGLEQPGMVQPAPELAGLLDDNFATMLEEMLASDNQSGACQLPDCPDPALLNSLAPAQDFAPVLPTFAQQQAPWMPSAAEQPEAWSFEKNRSGSGGC